MKFFLYFILVLIFISFSTALEPSYGKEGPRKTYTLIIYKNGKSKKIDKNVLLIMQEIDFILREIYTNLLTLTTKGDVGRIKANYAIEVLFNQEKQLNCKICGLIKYNKLLIPIESSSSKFKKGTSVLFGTPENYEYAGGNVWISSAKIAKLKEIIEMDN
jgi:hypothetical protein